VKKIEALWITFIPAGYPEGCLRFTCKVRADVDGKTTIHTFEYILDEDQFISAWERLMERAKREIESILKEDPTNG
jgi:hypothetical protein